MCDHANREEAMVTIQRNDQGISTIWCDPCLEPIIRALNNGRLSTVASCCGHGRRPGRISLIDGRDLLLMSKETADSLDGRPLMLREIEGGNDGD